MALQHILKNSAVSGKEPTASQLANGEIALNYHVDGPFLTCKDTSGAIRRITGVWISATSPSTPTPGEFWLDLSVTPAQLKVYKDTTDTWIQTYTVAVASTAVSGVVELATGAETITGADALRAVTPASLQAKLSDSTGLANSARIASSTAVKSAYDLADAALPRTGGTITGAVQFALGAAATPSITFTGDTNTGLFSPSADQLSVTTGGTERLRIDAAGQIEAVSLGAAAAPAWSFVSDPNTGIYSPGADQLALSTGGTGRLFVDASGRVGIGVTPTTTLDVAGPIRSLNGTIDARLQAGYAGAVGIGAQSNDAVLFIQNATERLRIDSSGRVGIGTSTPGALLETSSAASGTVNGEVLLQRIRSNAGNSVFLDIKSRRHTAGTSWEGVGLRLQHQVDGTAMGFIELNSLNSGQDIALGTAGTTRLLINSAGRVGIGTSSPGAALDVAGNIRLSAAAPNIEFNSGGGMVYGPASNTIAFATGGGPATPIERARIDANGRLLVGASASVTAVTFPSLVQSNSFYSYQSSLFSADANGSNTFFLKSRNATTGSHTVVQANDVLGQINFAGSDGANFVLGANIAAVVDGTPGTNDMPGRLVFSTTADGAATPTERMRIDSSGRVGIGVTPLSQLHAAQSTAGAIATFNFSGSSGGGSEIRVNNGFSSTTPIYSFWFNNTTGIGNPAANTISAIIAGTERFRIDSSGNVGIGTSSPVARLQVQAPSASRQYTSSVLDFSNIHIDGITAGPATSALTFSSGGGGGAAVAFNRGTSFDTAISFWTNSAASANAATERVRIDGTGRVGIGEAGPTELLHINGNMQVNWGTYRVASVFDNTYRQGLAFDSGNRQLRVFSTSGDTGGSIGFYTRLGTGSSATDYGTERLRIDSSGRVGIGTTAPGTALDVMASAGSAGAGNIRIAPSTPGQARFHLYNGGATAEWLFGQKTSTDHAFKLSKSVAGSESDYLTVTTTGSVGIGTTSPGSLLDVNGAITARGDGSQVALYMPGNTAIRSTGAGSITYLDLATGSASHGEFILRSSNTYAERLRVNSAGNVGIGTSSPGSLLDVRFPTSPVINNGNGFNTLRVWTSSALAADTGGAISLGGISTTGGSASSFGQIAGRKVNATSANYAGYLQFSVNDAGGTMFEAMRIDSAGRMGIGTTNPQDSVVNIAPSSAAGAFNPLLTHLSGGFAGSHSLYLGAWTSTGTDRIYGCKIKTNYNYASSGATALSFEVTNAGGSLFEAARIDSSGRVGIGTSAPQNKLEVIGDGERMVCRNATNSGIARIEAQVQDYASGPSYIGTSIVQNGSTTAGTNAGLSNANLGILNFQNTSAGLVVTNGATPLVFATTSTERLRIDSSGRVLVGSSTARSLYGQTGVLQTEGTGYASSGVNIILNNASTAGPLLMLGKSRGSANGSSTIVQNGDTLGEIYFCGADGTDLDTPGASIVAVVDATPGSNDMPGRLEFSTTPDGAAAPTQRMRLESNGNARFSNLASIYPATDNAVGNGGSGFRWNAIWAANGTIQTSDKRAKTDVSDAELGFNFIKSLRPVSYKWVEGGKVDTGERDDDGNYIYQSVPGGRTHWGFIAQEVKEAVDDAGVDFGGWILTDKDDPNSQQALRYDQFIAPLTKALQEAIAKIETLEAKVAALEAA